MNQGSKSRRVAHRSADWIAFLCPLIPFAAVSLVGQPAYIGAGIATVFMAGIGYRITGNASMLRQLVAVVMLVLGTLFALTFAVPYAGDVAKPLAAGLPVIAAVGVGISFTVVVLLFITTPAKPTHRRSGLFEA